MWRGARNALAVALDLAVVAVLGIDRIISHL
jgi:hypothetical protein